MAGPVSCSATRAIWPPSAGWCGRSCPTRIRQSIWANRHAGTCSGIPWSTATSPNSSACSNSSSARGRTSMNPLHTLRSFIDGLGERGDRPAILALQKQEMDRWSYAKLADHVQQLAQGMAKEGIGKDVPVALLAGTRPEWLIACLAVVKAGAVAIPLDIQLADDVLGHVLKDSNSRFLFTTSDQLDRLDRLRLKRQPRL